MTVALIRHRRLTSRRSRAQRSRSCRDFAARGVISATRELLGALRGEAATKNAGPEDD